MFLEETDYYNISGKEGLKIFSQSDEDIRKRAEDYAIDEVRGYLSSRFNVKKIFEQEGENRSPIIVMRCVDVALYHMVCAFAQKIGYEIREIRYKQAIEWLKEVQKGNVTPSLPSLIDGDDANDDNNPIQYGGMKKNKYD